MKSREEFWRDFRQDHMRLALQERIKWVYALDRKEALAAKQRGHQHHVWARNPYANRSLNDPQVADQVTRALLKQYAVVDTLLAITRRKQIRLTCQSCGESSWQPDYITNPNCIWNCLKPHGRVITGHRTVGKTGEMISINTRKYEKP